jgi:hypothetical protein
MSFWLHRWKRLVALVHLVGRISLWGQHGLLSLHHLLLVQELLNIVRRICDHILHHLRWVLTVRHLWRPLLSYVLSSYLLGLHHLGSHLRLHRVAHLGYLLSLRILLKCLYRFLNCYRLLWLCVDRLSLWCDRRCISSWSHFWFDVTALNRFWLGLLCRCEDLIINKMLALEECF